MTLRELSPAYREAAELLARRIRELRLAVEETEDPVEKWNLRRRILELKPLLTQMRELAELTEHYYDRGFWRDEKYTV
jgi:hypothetical protein